ncbi:MAG: glutamine-hydrolyzing carbamoyl-phosphate synthase small subunit [Thermoflavifilum sp.]|nr:glutamine-hydrolyzing carbamoyl-phosphate synthase small subunit [Thermoflavifilum sp.]
MHPSISPRAVLMLEDGTCFYGKAFGKIGTTSGEICFNTGMTGYQEVFTDPSYAGQLLIMNNCYIGNYGVKRDEVESSSIQIKGLIAKNISSFYSRAQASSSLEQYLLENNLVAIHQVDTRALVTHIRHQGAMNAIISSETDDLNYLKQQLTQTPRMEGLDLSEVASTTHVYDLGNPAAGVRIAVIDYGVKQHILQCLVERGAYLRVFPARTSIETCEAFEPDGYFVSNGPGDPAAMPHAIQLVKAILQTRKPFFGICLGHQLLALANGIPTYKMHHGHRGLNHPVKNLLTNRSEMTTQNHGFAVDSEALKQSKHLEVTHINLNDGSIEGIRMKHQPAFSVQYHPESTPGPHDSRYLFDDFIRLIKMHQDQPVE